MQYAGKFGLLHSTLQAYTSTTTNEQETYTMMHEGCYNNSSTNKQND